MNRKAASSLSGKKKRGTMPSVFFFFFFFCFFFVDQKTCGVMFVLGEKAGGTIPSGSFVFERHVVSYIVSLHVNWWCPCTRSFCSNKMHRIGPTCIQNRAALELLFCSRFEPSLVDKSFFKAFVLQLSSQRPQGLFPCVTFNLFGRCLAPF